ncbi:MAG: lipopolysaccharide biosynthesis protein [Flavobacteriaceae bacterium]|jgi:O-antigen/teichoic acid export membrane protein
MGIIAKQSIYNVVSIGLAFLIGAVNMVYLYPTYPGKEFQGLIVALLANSNLIQPFISFGVQHTLIKYFSEAQSKEERDRLLWFVLLFPLVIIALILPFYFQFNTALLELIAGKGNGVSRFPFLILAIAISTAYFEVFFSWLRVHLKTVFGNFLKEVYPRVLVFLLLMTYILEWIDLDGFINFLIIGYYLRLLCVMCYSFFIYIPSFNFHLPSNWTSLLRYSALIFLSGAAASFILDIDKSMIFAITKDENVAFYAVALYIAAVIEAPGRAMFQITSPMVAQAINSNDLNRLEELLKKSSINLMVVSGLAFLIVNLNLLDFYKLINQPGYASAFSVVIIISLGKFFSMSMGCLNNIISNSKYYPYVFWFSVSSAVLAVLLNYYLISAYGIMGAAFATLIVILFINSCKLILIYYAFNIHPFNRKSLSIIGSIFLIYGMVYSIPSIGSPILAILLRSLAILILFLVPFYFFKWSSEIAAVLKRFSRYK